MGTKSSCLQMAYALATNGATPLVGRVKPGYEVRYFIISVAIKKMKFFGTSRVQLINRKPLLAVSGID